jgi:hypothetical protein
MMMLRLRAKADELAISTTMMIAIIFDPLHEQG